MDEASDEQIEVKSIDKLRDTWIKIGCYRETDRLSRVLRTYQKALTLALVENLDHDFSQSIYSMHDNKGFLKVEWMSIEDGALMHRFIDEAWEDENECLVSHFSIGGNFIAGEDV